MTFRALYILGCGLTAALSFAQGTGPSLTTSSQVHTGTEITFHQTTVPADAANPNSPNFLRFQERVKSEFKSLKPKNNLVLKKEKDGGHIELLLDSFTPMEVVVEVHPPTSLSITGKKVKESHRAAIVQDQQKELVVSDTVLIHETVDVGTSVDLSKATASMTNGRLVVIAPYAPKGFQGVTEKMVIPITSVAPNS